MQDDIKELETFIAMRLKLIRKQKKIPLKKLANLTGLSYQTVQKYETGEIRIPVGVLYKYSEYMAIPIVNFFPSTSMDCLHKYMKKEEEVYPEIKLISGMGS